MSNVRRPAVPPVPGQPAPPVPIATPPKAKPIRQAKPLDGPFLPEAADAGIDLSGPAPDSATPIVMPLPAEDPLSAFDRSILAVWAFFRDFWWGWMTVLATIGWVMFLATLFSPPSRAVAVCYVGLLVGVMAPFEGVRARNATRSWAKWLRPAGIVCMIAAVVLFARYDHFQRTWCTEWNPEKLRYEETAKSPLSIKRGVVYHDTYTRFDSHITFRDLTTYDADGHLLRSSRGPMTASNKPHGEWKVVMWQPDCSIGREWYWYGEEVSEGEWHLRDRGAAR
jgi:hypothetical protein